MTASSYTSLVLNMVMILLFVPTRSVSSTPPLNSTTSNLIKHIFHNYDKAIRPSHGGPPVVVKVNLYVFSVSDLQEANMEYELFGFIRQYWKDERLAGKVSEMAVLTGNQIDNLWKPDPYCDNCKQSNLKQSDQSVNSMLRLYPSGKLMYSRLLIVKAECNMDLRKFPMDEQECYVKLTSYSFATDYIVYEWHGDVTVRNAELAQFEIKSVETFNTTDKFTTGDFSAVMVKFIFKRRLGYYLIQVYAPDVFVVILSWIVFWMDRDDMGNRMALGITIILTIMFLLGSTNTTMPRVSYPKALDWYLMTSFGFVFLSLMECILLYYVKTRNETKSVQIQPLDTVPATEQKDYNKKAPAILESLEGNPNKTNRVPLTNNYTTAGRKSERKVRFDGAWIDTVSRVIFPASFLIYNLGYWCHYL